VRRFKDSEVDVIVLVQDVNRSQRKWCSLLPASLDFRVRAQVFVHRNFSGLLHKPFRRAQSTSLLFIRTCAASIHDLLLRLYQLQFSVTAFDHSGKPFCQAANNTGEPSGWLYSEHRS